ncbi:MAG: hypothetical protein L6Q37_11120 [Bdellovibrionaceae bacterium]|nr:hypothetical protein [Pseudobdellovibrionaceae bacterium]NUM57777.1 hypothetical protein [Pseudobdellovibrionaceae bacterium]
MTINVQDKNLANFIKLVEEYTQIDVYDSKNARKLSDEILEFTKKVPNIADTYFKYCAQQSLSEGTVKSIYQLGGIISYMNSSTSQFTQKELDMFYTVQYMFDCYLRFQLPFNLWPELAKKSWSYLVNFINDKYQSKKDFESETQSHWGAMTEKLDEFQDHPKYGPKIQARLTGYV